MTLTAALASACGRSSSTRGGFVFLTNGVDAFWTIAAAGVRDAEAEFGVKCDVQMPEDGASATQMRLLENALSRGVEGIAISPIDGQNMVAMVDAAAAQVPLITQDADAPGSQRRCYVGTDNYAAGRACADLVREAMPEGGSLMLFVGRLEQDNARLRRQGLIDSLLERDPDPTRFDKPGPAIIGKLYTVIDTRTDAFDKARAKSNAEDALARYPDLGCMVGLFNYNAPACLEALRGAGKLGQVHVVSFDEADETLQGILDGTVQGTVTQQPYRYGYESVRILSALSRGDESVLPAGGFLEIPFVVVRKPEVETFRTNLKQLIHRGE